MVNSMVVGDEISLFSLCLFNPKTKSSILFGLMLEFFFSKTNFQMFSF